MCSETHHGLYPLTLVFATNTWSESICHFQILPVPNAVKLCCLEIFRFFFFKYWIFIKFEIILLLISFQVLGDMCKHFHITFQDIDSQRFSSNKNLPWIFTQPIGLWDWFYKIIKRFRCQLDPRHAWSSTPYPQAGRSSSSRGQGARSVALVQHLAFYPPPLPLGLNEQRVDLGSQV